MITTPTITPVSVDYFLSDTDTYQLPLSTVNFAVCELTYTFDVTPQLGIDGISFDDDPDERLFTYSFDLDATYI